jgi:hypothetical protein
LVLVFEGKKKNVGVLIFILALCINSFWPTEQHEITPSYRVTTHSRYEETRAIFVASTADLSSL